MTNGRSVLFSQLSVGVAALLSMSAAAQTLVYDNSATDHLLRYPPANSTLEFGNQVILAGSPSYITHFDFEYFDLSHLGPVSAQVRFYYNNSGTFFSGYETPSAIPFFDSGIFNLATVGAPTTRSTINFDSGVDWANAGLPISSSDFTWTVQFSGMNLFDSVGVDVYGPPVVGAVFDDIWVNSGGWLLVTNSANQNTFGARFETPEPSSLALLVLGGLGFMVAGWRIRKQ